MDYSYYRNLVTSKTNGRNIHKINGLLGIVVNRLWICKITKDKNETIYFDNKKMVEDAVSDICKETGVSITFEELERDYK